MFNILLCRSSAFFCTFRHIESHEEQLYLDSRTTWKTNWKLIFSEINWLFYKFENLNNLIFIIYLCELCFKSKWEGSGRKLAGSNSDVVKTTLRLYVISKWPSLFFKFFKNLSPFPCHFVTYNREYYKWLSRLRCHVQVGRLLVQGTWLGLVTLSVIWGPMWPTG